MLKNAYKADLQGTSWLGEVVDVEDTLKIGRIKIKVYGLFDNIPTADIPWAYPGNNTTGGSNTGGGFLSVPKKGAIISVKFDEGNLYHPEYFFNQQISDEVKAEIENSYANAHIIIYDTVTSGDVKIFFTEEKGVMIDYQKTQINIKPDKSVLVQTSSGKSKIEILDTGIVNITAKKVIIDHSDTIELGKGATEKVILGDKFMTLFNSHIHTGNLGAPTSPPIKPMTPGELSQKKVVTK